MGSSRPNHLDLSDARQFDPNRLGTPSPRNLPSPRSGDVLTGLSPLDAFAFHSSVLARQFKDENEGRRISRLPPLTIAQELSKRKVYNAPRPEDISSAAPPAADAAAEHPQFENVNNSKHRSFYPFVSTWDDAASVADTIAELPEEEENAARQDYFDNHVRSSSPENTFPAVNAASSSADNSRRIDVVRTDFAAASHHSHSRNQAPPNQRQDSGDSLKPASANLTVSRSPNSSRAKSPQPSIRQVRNDSGDDVSDSLSVFSSDPFERKTSAPSVSSRPRSPFSPVFPHGRSPSVTSETSISGLGHPRKSFNFSRPMSPALRSYDPSPHTPSDPAAAFLAADIVPPKRPSFDVLSITDSIDSPRFTSTPQFGISTDREGTSERSIDTFAPEQTFDSNGAPSYIYAKYSLPRGRVVSRQSLVATDFFAHKFEWESPFLGESNAIRLPQDDRSIGQMQHSKQSAQQQTPTQDLSDRYRSRFREDTDLLDAPQFPRPSSSMTDVSSAVSKDSTLEPPPKKSSLEQLMGKRSMDSVLPQRPKSSSSNEPRLSSDRKSSRQRKFSFGSHKAAQELKASLKDSQNRAEQLHVESQPPVPTSLDPQVLTKKLETTTTPSVEQISPEKHLAIGIECHESGSLQKSTYHLRMAARAGLPTAMLLYGLACRHGWGVRANMSEAVSWLRKAIETAGLEVADDEALSRLSQMPTGSPDDFMARKRHKAQLALAIYELGVSYLNGWGIAQDKSLALRMFEISAGWGDADALSEAGFCYAKGVGCKKNLMKAAAYYRQAAEKGVSMTGNSWIYKEKYNPKESSPDERSGRSGEKDKDKKQTRDKSRSRAMFGAKKKGAS